jgi:hypothetical protein
MICIPGMEPCHVLDDNNLNSVLALTGLSFPVECIDAMRAYPDQNRLARLGLMTSPHEIAGICTSVILRNAILGRGLPAVHAFQQQLHACLVAVGGFAVSSRPMV